MEIKDTTVMITGAARIGRNVALWLARAGARNFVLTYRTSHEAMQQLADELAKLNATARLYQLDASDEIAVQAAIDDVNQHFGAIDILINMASTYYSRKIDSLNVKDWYADLDNNATGTMVCINAVAPKMRERGRGRIINFVDWTVASRRVAYPGYAAYYTAKQAVLGLTEAFALEYAPHVLINSIAPGPILPPPDLDEAQTAAIVAETPLQRWGGSDEIALTVEFLIRTNFITGECIRVDGGRHLL